MAKNSTLALDAALAAAAGLTCAVALAVGLNAGAAPQDFEDRALAIETKVKQAQKAAPPNEAVRPRDVICREPLEAQQGRLVRQLNTDADALALALTGVQAVAVSGVGRGGSLSAVELKFSATGSNDAIMALLDKMSRQKPLIFIETMDLASQGAEVELSLSGRVFCSA